MKRTKEPQLRITGARENNLKNVSLSLPKNVLIVVTGPSGSGKSSFAFDVIHAEGQRRFLEGMSSYARSVLGARSRPEVDRVDGLSPTIAIDQKSVVRSPRSTVGTLSEIADYFRSLFSYFGEAYCPSCGVLLKKSDPIEFAHNIQKCFLGRHITITAPIDVKKFFSEQGRDRWQRSGYTKVYIDGKEYDMKSALEDDALSRESSWEIIVDQFFLMKKKGAGDRERLSRALEVACMEDGGVAHVRCEKECFVYRLGRYCVSCDITIPDFSAKNFSFNHVEGACRACDGLGVRLAIDPERVITSDRLTLEEGALGPMTRFLGRKDSMQSFWSRIETFASRHHIDLTVPIASLSKKDRNLLLFSKEGEDFEGIFPFLESKHHSSSSENMRKELERYMRKVICRECGGSRLRPESSAVRFGGMTMQEWNECSLETIVLKIKEMQQRVSQEQKNTRSLNVLVGEMLIRLQILVAIGLGYLSLSRTSDTLSGGEAQRIRLCAQLVSELSGVIYVLDEPSMGLHPQDTERLITTLHRLRDAGNTVIVVEHDRDIIEHSDWMVDIGPGSGEEGGKIVYSGERVKARRHACLTAQYLWRRKEIAPQSFMREASEYLTVYGAKEHNLKDIDVSFPLGVMTAVTGVSGSGKSTLVHTILSRALKKHFFRAQEEPGRYKKIKGLDAVDKVITITQSPIGRSSRSNVATYTGAFSHIRHVFSQTQESVRRGYDASQFSFNLKGGRCEACQGEGVKKIEMYLLPDQYAECETCNGSRYSKETLDILYKGVNISQVLDMSVSYARVFFKDQPLIEEKLAVLERVGLGYLRLGQGAPDLSGGEAQRIKLATELSKKSTGNTVYILDEPTVGLHFEDVRKLVKVLDDLVDMGNTVIMVEHNTDVIAHADWMIDFGPGGGEAGGEIVYAGRPCDAHRCKKSKTGHYIHRV